ncbi:MAG: hypothetical protein R3C97_03960 [Geminicoccaceae bacterium]
MTKGRLLCAGMGYTASRLAGELLKRDWSVVGTSRSGRDDTLRFQGKPRSIRLPSTV